MRIDCYTLNFDFRNEYLLHSHDVSSTGTQDLRLPLANEDDEVEDEVVEEPMELGEAADKEEEEEGRRKNARPAQQRMGKRALDRSAFRV